jgi:hypothetical protein
VTADATSSDPHDQPVSGGPGLRIARRALLRGTVAVGASATIAGFWFEGFGNPLRRRWVVPTAPGAPGKTFSVAEWPVLEAALDRLVPSGPGSPGSQDVNAIGYLDAVLAEPEFDPLWNAEIVKAGVPRLEEAAKARGAAGFPALDEAGQIAVLQGFEGTEPGKKWLKKMLWFALEALLGDPVHGCQPGEVGWTWLKNPVGEPRPRTPGWKPTGR